MSNCPELYTYGKVKQVKYFFFFMSGEFIKCYSEKKHVKVNFHNLGPLRISIKYHKHSNFRQIVTFYLILNPVYVLWPEPLCTRYQITA